MDEPACPGCRDPPQAVGRTRSPGRRTDPEAGGGHTRRQTPGGSVSQGTAQAQPQKTRTQVRGGTRPAWAPAAAARIGRRASPGPPASTRARTAAARSSRPAPPSSSRIEIPRTPLIRQFTVHLGHRTDRGRRTQGRHPLQTSDAAERGGQSDRPRRPGRGGPVAHSGRAVPRQSGGRVWVPVRDRPFAWGHVPRST